MTCTLFLFFYYEGYYENFLIFGINIQRVSILFINHQKQQAMETKTYGSLIEVFRGSLWEAELVKGLLESAGVSAMLKDETLSGCYFSLFRNRRAGTGNG